MPRVSTHTLELEYEDGKVGSGASIETDEAASGGKYVRLAQGQAYELEFSIPAEGEFVLWHRYRSGAAVSGEIELDGVKLPWRERYDMASLYGSVIGDEWLWHRYLFRGNQPANGIFHLAPGRHMLRITVQQPITLDKLVITSDHSFVPPGKLCAF
jgi:hypothetical protein